MEKQEFQIGDCAYLIDLDSKMYIERITKISLCHDDTIEYETHDGFYFSKNDIGTTIFKDAESRESYLMQK